MYIQRCVFLLLCTMLDTSCAALSVWILTEHVCLSDEYQQVEDRQVLRSHVWVMKTIWRIYQKSPRQKYLISRASIWIKCRRKIRMLFNVEHNADLFHQNSLIQDQFSLIGIKGGIMKYFFIFYHEKTSKAMRHMFLLDLWRYSQLGRLLIQVILIQKCFIFGIFPYQFIKYLSPDHPRFAGKKLRQL